MMEFLSTLESSGHMTVFAICGTVVLVLLLFMLRGRITGVTIGRSGIRLLTSDADLIFSLHGNLDPIDHDCMTQIAEETDSLELLDANAGTDITVVLINQLASEVLKLSAYANHHARELYIDHKGYCRKKLRKVVSKLKRYQWTLGTALPTDDEVIKYISTWLTTVVIPPVLIACEKKIEFYGSILARKAVSDSLRTNVKAWKERNEKYREALMEYRDILIGSPIPLFGVTVASLGSDPEMSAIIPPPTSEPT